MRRAPALLVLTVLAAGPIPAADPGRPRPKDRPVAVSAEARAEIRAMLRHVAGSAKPGFPKAAVTIEQARHYAGVPPKMTWQGEIGEWFVFGFPDRKGGPDRWGGVYFVQKGSNVVGIYREKW